MVGFAATFDILDEVKSKNGGIWMRLVQFHGTSTQAIQTFGSMSGEWSTTYRYGDINQIWTDWKTMVQRLKPRMGTC